MNQNSLWNRFESAFKKQSEKTALSFLRNGQLESVLLYGDLLREAGKMAGFLLESAVKKGDRVILFLPKSVVAVVAHLAVQKIGAISVPLNPGFTLSEMTYLMGDAEATMAITGKEQAFLVRKIDSRIHMLEVPTNCPYQKLTFFQHASDLKIETTITPEDPGLMIYTSGTTGKPKGVILTQRNLIHDADTIIRLWEITDRDILCHGLPLFHIHGLCFALHTALLAGVHTVMLDQFSADQVIRRMSKSEDGLSCSVFMGVPTMYRQILEKNGPTPRDFKGVRLWTSGSAPLLSADFEKIKDLLGQEPVEREGMSETGMNFSNPLKEIKKPGSIGLPLPDLEVRIVNPESGEEVPRGETGEIWLRSPSITPGYWRNPEATEKAFYQGWFRTGDLGKVDEDGYYFLTDRLKTIIISGGENISPKEVEGVINQVEGVAESAVVGLPDEKWGEKVVAAVVLKSTGSVDADQIVSFCRRHLHPWKVPKQILVLENLPRNTMGKVLREEIKSLFSLHPHGDPVSTKTGVSSA
ncbi:MAG: AMP-binding protein [Thermodesulfobacteriota bacterium]